MHGQKGARGLGAPAGEPHGVAGEVRCLPPYHAVQAIGARPDTDGCRTNGIRWTVEWRLGAAAHRALAAQSEHENPLAGLTAALRRLRGDARVPSALGDALRCAPKSLRAGLAAFDSGPAGFAADAPAAAEAPGDARKNDAKGGDELAGACHFYLHDPAHAAGTAVRVLPVAADAPLAAALRGATLVEFPTLYVLGAPPERLRAEGGLALDDGRRLEWRDEGRRGEIRLRMAELQRARGEKTVGEKGGGDGGGGDGERVEASGNAGGR